jgi:hypothetical protein
VRPADDAQAARGQLFGHSGCVLNQAPLIDLERRLHRFLESESPRRCSASNEEAGGLHLRRSAMHGRMASPMARLASTVSLGLVLFVLPAACGSSAGNPDGAGSTGAGGNGASGQGGALGGPGGSAGIAGMGGINGAAGGGANGGSGGEARGVGGAAVAGNGGSGGAGQDGAAGTAGGGSFSCGTAVCGASQVCVVPCCGGSPNFTCTPPPPYCLDVPAACGGTPTCSCLAPTCCSRLNGKQVQCACG